MEAINNSAKLIAQAIELLKPFEDNESNESIIKALELLKTALDKLVMKI